MKTIIALLITDTRHHGLAHRAEHHAASVGSARRSETARACPASSASRRHEAWTPFVMHGTVVDPAGKPAAGVEILAYQTDNTGIYAARRGGFWRLKG